MAATTVVALQRAFQAAGVRTTVTSLWKVDDDGTRVLMERFYRNLWENRMGKLDALRESQLRVLRNPDAVHAADDPHRGAGRILNPDDGEVVASPRYWAAFQLSGDWRQARALKRRSARQNDHVSASAGRKQLVDRRAPDRANGPLAVRALCQTGPNQVQ